MVDRSKFILKNLFNQAYTGSFFPSLVSVLIPTNFGITLECKSNVLIIIYPTGMEKFMLKPKIVIGLSCEQIFYQSFKPGFFVIFSAV